MQRQMQWVLAALALATAACGAFAQQSTIPEEARKNFFEGNAALKNAQGKEDYALAESLYQKALSLAPNWVDAVCNLSKAEQGLEKYDDAIALSKKCIQLSSSTPALARAEQDHEYELEGLKKVHDAQELRAGAWTDPSTGLMWMEPPTMPPAPMTASDAELLSFFAKYGYGDYEDAVAYCGNVKLGGYSNWRLPTIAELQALYDPNVTQVLDLGGGTKISLHIRGQFRSDGTIFGYIWSSSQGNGPNEAMVISFDEGRSFSLSHHNTGLLPSKTLCVRSTQ